MKNLNICIAGLGNVGSQLISIIENTHEFINSKAQISFNILGISAKHKNKQRIFNVKNYQWTDNPLDLLNIKNCNVLIELIGEEKGLSFELIKAALENKIHVITANKALLAKNGLELFKIAEKNQVLLLYEAAVAGGIPVIKTIKNNIFLNKFKKVSGILNGTTNYILTTMLEENLTFKEVLLIAKSKGFTSDAESELDIGGIDSAHKLTILASLCFGAQINFSNNHVIGIADITISDIINVNKLGYKIKLISEAYIENNQIYCVTEPKLIDKKKPLANVDGVLNAVKIETNHLESLFLEGEGAGGRPTASSVISDLYEICSCSNFSSLGYNTNNLINYKKFSNLEIESAYYLRIMTRDITGVLSKITGYFKDFNISIEKILQLPDNNKKISVPIIIFTHLIKKNRLLDAIKLIEKQDFILEKIAIISIDTN